MKKLISLVAVVAILATSSICAFATDITTLVEGAEAIPAVEGAYSVIAPSTGDYATILAVKGKAIQVGAIQYINQAATNGTGSATFNFALNDALLNNETSAPITDDVYVLTGGDGNMNVAGYIDVTPEGGDKTAFTVSGTVSNYVDQEFYDELLVPVVEELFEGEGLEEYLAAYKTTAYLVDLETIEEFIGCYMEESDEFSYVAKADISAVDGSFAFEEIPNGTYAVVISNANALPYMEYAIVEDDDVDAGEVYLLAGDLLNAKDFLVNSADLALIVAALGEIGEDSFVPGYDVAFDCLINSADLAEVVANLGEVTAYGTDLILELFS